MSFYILFSVILAILASPEVGWNTSAQFKIIEYFSFCFLSTYSIIPVLLVQSSISLTAFWKAFFLASPWWIICTVLWSTGTFIAQSNWNVTSYRICEGLFVTVAFLCPFCLCSCILTKVIPSRVQLGSISNRNAVEFLLVYSLLFGIVYLCNLGGIKSSANDESSDQYTWNRDAAIVMTSISFVSSILFPFALYRYSTAFVALFSL